MIVKIISSLLHKVYMLVLSVLLTQLALNVIFTAVPFAPYLLLISLC